MSGTLPVAIFHEGCPKHLKASVESAQRYNERVILLGNEANKHIADEWYDCAALDLSRYDEFKKVFVNYSTYTDFFATIVFKRYFATYAIMEKLGFDRIIIAESDLYTCVDYSTLSFLDDAYAMVSTVSGQEENYGWTSCCHCSYWTKEALNDFLDFCVKSYTTDNELLIEKWNYHLKRREAGGVCDMTLAYLWAKDKPGVLNSALILDGGTIDQNICDRANYSEDEYLYNNFAKLKRYKFKKDANGIKQPFLIKKDKTLVQVYSIHCSGRGKACLPYLDRNYFLVCLAEVFTLVKMKLGEMKNRLRKG